MNAGASTPGVATAAHAPHVADAKPAAALDGLVLAGGRSARMHRDKAGLVYAPDGRSQLAVAFERLATLTQRCFVSVRADQQDDPLRAPFPQIVDRREGLGPLAGIIAALESAPERAWLVVACDLPFLDEATLRHLIEHRDPTRVATAYRSAHDGLPEPLCAIWEPAALELALGQATRGASCPRKLLIRSDAHLLDLPRPAALDNVNSIPEYWHAMENLHAPDATPRAALKIRVQYFALLREQARCAEETLETGARSPGELYEELRARHAFTLAPEALRVAVNAEFGDWRQPLAQGDTVVFIPPVAGG